MAGPIYSTKLFTLGTGTYISSSAGEWDFKLEPMKDGQFPTVRRVRIMYYPIGSSFVVNVKLLGVNEDGSQVTSTPANVDVTLPNSASKIAIAYADLEITAMLVQCIITVAANTYTAHNINRVTLVGEWQEFGTM